MENLLIYQRGSFARMQQLPSEHKNRYIAIAEKRHIGHLLVVSGPTSAGKKSLMRALIANKLPALARGKKPRRHLPIRDLHAVPEKVLEHYERWFAFAERWSKDHIVAVPHEDMAFRSVEEWRDHVSGFRPPLAVAGE